MPRLCLYLPYQIEGAQMLKRDAITMEMTQARCGTWTQLVPDDTILERSPPVKGHYGHDGVFRDDRSTLSVFVTAGLQLLFPLDKNRD